MAVSKDSICLQRWCSEVSTDCSTHSGLIWGNVKLRVLTCLSSLNVEFISSSWEEHSILPFLLVILHFILILLAFLIFFFLSSHLIFLLHYSLFHPVLEIQVHTLKFFMPPLNGWGAEVNWVRFGPCNCILIKFSICPASLQYYFGNNSLALLNFTLKVCIRPWWGFC